jgi:hypothetical protein
MFPGHFHVGRKVRELQIQGQRKHIQNFLRLTLYLKGHER